MVRSVIGSPQFAPEDAADADRRMEDQRRHSLRRMKGTALGLLVGAAVVYLVARSQEHRAGWIGYVAAAAEAGMVGALADWFAVTALFRYPLGLRIPHTAIIPNRKDEIGEGLGEFVQSQFLTPEVVSARLEHVGVARRLGPWLASPEAARTLTDQAADVVHAGLDLLKDDDLQAEVRRAVEDKARATPAAPLIADALELAIRDGRHQRLLDVALLRISEGMAANRETLRRQIYAESPWWVPERVDDAVFDKLYFAAVRFISDIARSPSHEIRRHIDQRLRQAVADFRTDPEAQAKANQWRDELLDHSEFGTWVNRIWADLKASILERTADPESDLRLRISEGISGFGLRLIDDPDLQEKVDGWVQQGVVSLVKAIRGDVGELIASTVASWDSAEASERIELAVGRDLQFIRINGTVVGAIAGIAIHAIDTLVF